MNQGVENKALQQAPRVSLGLPVFNGENFLEATLESIVAQTFSDFELIICDNASTDRTAAICRRFMEKDDRVQYHRSATNRGAAANYNWCVEHARGEFFKWCAHDDLLAPNFLQECVGVLDGSPAAVLAYARWALIDAAGNVTDRMPGVDMGLNSPKAGVRYHKMIDHMGRCTPVFGLVRLDALLQTRLIDTFPHADRIALLELAVQGPFECASKSWFYLRLHPKTSMAASRNSKTLMLWYDTNFKGSARLSVVNLVWQKLVVVTKSSMSLSERVLCWRRVLRFGWGEFRKVVHRRLPGQFIKRTV